MNKNVTFSDVSIGKHDYNWFGVDASEVNIHDGIKSLYDYVLHLEERIKQLEFQNVKFK